MDREPADHEKREWGQPTKTLPTFLCPVQQEGSGRSSPHRSPLCSASAMEPCGPSLHAPRNKVLTFCQVTPWWDLVSDCDKTRSRLPSGSDPRSPASLPSGGCKGLHPSLTDPMFPAMHPRFLSSRLAKSCLTCAGGGEARQGAGLRVQPLSISGPAQS